MRHPAMIPLCGTDLLLSTDGPGRAFLAMPTSGHARWLLPEGGLPKEASMEQFFPVSPAGRVLRRLIGLGLVHGNRVWVDSPLFERFAQELAAMLSEPSVSLAISCGTAGAYRKHTVLAMRPDGTVLAYVKIPASPLAKDAIQSEEENLNMLRGVGELAGHVPALIGRCSWQNSHGLVLTPGPVARGPNTMGELHAEFLRRLHVATKLDCRFPQSPMLQRMRATLNRLQASVPPEWRRRYASAVEAISRSFGSRVMPFSVAHRDFAPWNTRRGDRGLFVFDWEAAREGCIPLYDAFHFDAIRAALIGGRYRPGRFCDQLLASCWPEGRPYLHGLYLSYLVDMSLFYLEARVRAPQIGDERVLRWYGAQVDANVGVRS